MTPEMVMTIATQAMKMTLMLSAPLLLVALAAGLVVSLFQALTSIQEMTLSSIPKMAAVALVLLVLSPWMLQLLTDFATEVFQATALVSD